MNIRLILPIILIHSLLLLSNRVSANAQEDIPLPGDMQIASTINKPHLKPAAKKNQSTRKISTSSSKQNRKKGRHSGRPAATLPSKVVTSPRASLKKNRIKKHSVKKRGNPRF